MVCFFFISAVTEIESTFVPYFICFSQSFYGYGDLFSETWRAFSEYDIIHLKTFDSKRVGIITTLANQVFLEVQEKMPCTYTAVLENNFDIILCC